ncbi:MAG: TonB family protein [Bdellovibrionales bacterium]|nr:TonB family protein [Massilia sp.]
MSALTFSSSRGLDAGVSLEGLRAKFGPMGVVIAIHAILFYLIYSGMLTRMVDTTLQQAVMVTFVAPPRPKPPPPAAAAPKVVPVAKIRPPALPRVAVPLVQVVQLAVQPNVISVMPAAAPAEKAPAPAPAIVSAPAAPVPGTPKTITSGVEYIQAPQPVYPPMSKRMGEQGKVILRVLVSESGKPGEVQIQTSSGSARLDEAGRQAAMRAVFKPHLEDGRAVAVYVIVPLNFQLAS